MLSPKMSRSRLACALAAVALTGGLAACSQPEEPETPETSAVTTAEETTSEAEESEAESESESTTETSEASSKDDEENEVGEVRERFASLAPESLFDALDTCTETSIEGSYDCSGSEIGQFQFFDSDSKAASSTQVLTELRSSRVVEDTGRKVVGWSVLGTSALITVVDNEEGLVLQQLMSGDKEDPAERIYELGLAEDDGSGVKTPNPDSKSAPTTTKQSQ